MNSGCASRDPVTAQTMKMMMIKRMNQSGNAFTVSSFSLYSYISWCCNSGFPNKMIIIDRRQMGRNVGLACVIFQAENGPMRDHLLFNPWGDSNMYTHFVSHSVLPKLSNFRKFKFVWLHKIIECHTWRKSIKKRKRI